MANTETSSQGAAGFGPMLREWRKARGASQLDLALNCGLSQRHLSFLESGRSRPSRGMVLHLASALDVPLRQQNAMLLSAGFAPVYKERSLNAPEMEPVDRALEHALNQQNPFPALVVDRAHAILRSNRAMQTLMAFLLGESAARAAAGSPVNAIGLLLSPEGLKPHVENWEEAAGWAIRRLRAEAMVERANDGATGLLATLMQLPGVAEASAATAVEDFPPTLAVRFRKGKVRLALFSMIATVGTPLDVSLQDLRLELFYPADEQTAAWFRQATAGR
jgi:transcriptional regulator with XRE-family HTH domain